MAIRIPAVNERSWSLRSSGNHAHAHSHTHGHKPTAGKQLAKIFSPTNIVTMIGTIGIASLIHSLLDQQHENHIDASTNGLNLPDLANYAAQIPISILIWSVLSKFVPEISFKGGVKFNPTHSYAVNKGRVGKIFGDGFKHFGGMWKFVLVVTGLYTLIQGLTNYAKSHTNPDNKPVQYTLTLSSFALKILALFYADAWVNSKGLNLAAFWQSLTEACACCGSPRLACIQVAPVFVDLYHSLSGHGLSSIDTLNGKNSINNYDGA